MAYNSVMNKKGMCQSNFQPTRFRNNSLINHIFVSHPHKLDSVETKPCIIADHHHIKAQYHCKPLAIRPKFRRVRNHHLVNSDNLTEQVKINKMLGRICEITDLDKIADTIVSEMNHIIEDITP